jgi:anti-anti-sigma factor
MAPRPFFVWGEIDLANAHTLRDDLFLAIDGCADDLLVDCTALAFMDSSGVRAILDAQTRLQQTGRALHIVNLQSGPRRVFETLGLLEQLRVDA